MFRARLRNPYGGPGNLIGVSFGSYEVLFSRTGVVRLDAVDSDGSRRTLATASIPRLSSDWFEVVVSPGFLTIDVWLNGTEVLSYEDDAFERGGAIGVVTHWSPGEVDRVDFNDAFLISPYMESFAAKPPYEQVISGTWAAAGGTYNSTAGRATDVSLLYGSYTQPFAPGASMDFSYRARVKLPSSSAQSSIGFVTHYNASAGEYYEVLLTGGGQVIMKKHVQGTVVRQATGTYVAAPNAWINLELRCVGNQGRVLVNGTSRLHGILQGQLRSGQVGVVTHGTQGKFDDVVFAEWK